MLKIVFTLISEHSWPKKVLESNCFHELWFQTSSKRFRLCLEHRSSCRQCISASPRHNFVKIIHKIASKLIFEPKMAHFRPKKVLAPNFFHEIWFETSSKMFRLCLEHRSSRGQCISASPWPNFVKNMLKIASKLILKHFRAQNGSFLA